MRTPFNTTSNPANFGVNLSRRETEPGKVAREILALPVTALTTAGVTLLSVPTAASFQVQSFIVTNYTAGAATFSLYVVPSGVTADTSNIVYSAEQVNGNDTASPYDRWGIVAPSGSSIVATASANSTLNITLSGMMIYSGDLM